MNNQERIEILASGIKTEMDKILSKNLSDDASLAIFKAMLNDAIKDLTDNTNERVSQNFQGSRNIIKLFISLGKSWDIVKWIKTDLKNLLSLAMDLASDKNFSPSDNITLEQSLRSVMNDELELRGF